MTCGSRSASSGVALTRWMNALTCATSIWLRPVVGTLLISAPPFAAAIGWSVAECHRRVVADPLPQGRGAAGLGVGHEPGWVDVAGLHADRAHQELAVGLGVPLHQVCQWRAAVAGHRLGESLGGQPYCLLGQEQPRLASLPGCAYRDQECHGDGLGVLQACVEADDRLVQVLSFRRCWLVAPAWLLGGGRTSVQPTDPGTDAASVPQGHR